MPFTQEELAEMAAADAEIEAEFCLTQEEVDDSRERDYFFRYDNMDDKQKGQRRYREANKDKIAKGKLEIKRARKFLGMTQKQFANLLGVTQQAVSNWENFSAPRNWREIVSRFGGTDDPS